MPHLIALREVIVAAAVAIAAADLDNCQGTSKSNVHSAEALLQRGSAKLTLEHDMMVHEQSAADCDHHGEQSQKAAAHRRRYTNKLKPYVLLGPEDSGTNLLEMVIEANWPNTFISSQGAEVLWKHANSGAEDIYRVIRSVGFRPFLDFSNLPAVAMVRSPISQVSSWMKEPYDMALCVNRSIAELASPCYADLVARPVRERHDSDDPARPILYSSVMDVYNKYLQQYRDIARDAVFGRFLQISYEDLVYSPAVVVQMLALVLGVTAPSEVVVVKENLKGPRFSSNSREEALERLRGQQYLEALGDIGLQKLCPLLNTSLLTELHEGSFLREDLKQTRPYIADCIGFLG